MSIIEIERKFLLSKLPDLPYEESIYVDQTYLKSHDDIETRVRFVEKDGAFWYILDMKHPRVKDEGGELVRREVSVGIGPEEFHALLELRDPSLNSIRKTRHVYKYRGRELEVDVFDEIPLVLLEVELDAADDEVHLPEAVVDVLIDEVTEDHRYYNVNLAQWGIPQKSA